MFHLSLPVERFRETVAFYETCFDAKIDEFRPGIANVFAFGAQITFHDDPASPLGSQERSSMHFGPVVSREEWARIRNRLIGLGHKLIMCDDGDHTQGARAKLMIADPSGNLIEVNSIAP